MKNAARSLAAILILAMLLCAGIAGAEGILPILQTPKPQETYAISLHSATGLESFSLSTADGGGYKYNYDNVTYACYTQFSIKLAEEGYFLVNSETLDNGTVRAVVTNGQATITLDYNMDKKTASVSYPPAVLARETDMYADYTELRDGSQISLLDHANATVEGWSRRVSNYDSNESGPDVNWVVLTFDVDYYNPEEIRAEYLFRNTKVYYDNEKIELNRQGIWYPDYPNHVGTSDRFKGKMRTQYAMMFKLTREQLMHPEKVTVTFSDYEYAKRYMYRLSAYAPEGLPGTWQGQAVPQGEGEAFDLKADVYPDGTWYLTFVQGDYTKSFLAGQTLKDSNKLYKGSIDSNRLQKFEGTFEYADGKLTVNASPVFKNIGTCTYTIELQKQPEQQ